MNYFTDGRDLRDKRAQACLSLAELSKMSGVSKGSIGNFETGTRNLSRKAQRAIYNALASASLQSPLQAVAEAPEAYGSPEMLRAENLALKAELAQALETISNLSVALARREGGAAALAAKPTVCASAPRAYGAGSGAGEKKERKGA